MDLPKDITFLLPEKKESPTSRRIVLADGSTIKWIDEYGQLHREDGPALEINNNEQYWYWHGKMHRLYGPAAICPNGDKHWYQNDKPHRLDGPAIEHQDGTKQYFVEGKEYTEDAFFQLMFGNL